MKICTFCKYPILRGDMKVCCSCKAVYHTGCWHVNGQCDNEGCLSTEAYTVKPETKSVKNENPEKELSSPDSNSNKEITYKTNPMDTKTKIIAKNLFKRIRWGRIGIIVISVTAIILVLFLLSTLAVSLLGFGKDKKLYNSGIKKLEENKYLDASADFEEVIKINPKYPEIKPKLMETYRKLMEQFKHENKYNEAIKTYQKITGLSSSDEVRESLIDIYLQWGDYLLSQRSYQPATEKFQKVLELDKKDSEAKEKLIQTFISILYDVEYDTTQEQLKLIINDKECRNKIKSDGIKLYSAHCQIIKSDIDDDGFKDIVVAGEDTDSSPAGIDIYKIDTGKPKLIKSVDTSGYYLNKLGNIDLNADKHTEIFSDWTEPKSTKFGFTIFLFTKEKELSYRNSNKISDCPLSFEDINKDGTIEIIAKQSLNVQIDGEYYLFPHIYKWQNCEFVEVSSQYKDIYKKIYISALEKKLNNPPSNDDPLKKAAYEDTIRMSIEELYDIIGLKYDSKSGAKSPEETIEANFDYINRHEFYKAYMLRSAKRRQETPFENFYNLWRENISIRVEEITLINKDENKAEVRAVFEATEQVNLKETKTQVYRGTYYMIKESGLWYLDDSKVIQ
jgi:tetratricopeptide (TPR) repeat protein